MKRIVLTSSVRAVIQEPARTYTEEDWADDAVKEVEEKKTSARGMSMYSASKVLAERGTSRWGLCAKRIFKLTWSCLTAAWDFHAEHEHEIGWDVVAIDLGWVFGVRFEGSLLSFLRANCRIDYTADRGRS